MAVYHFTLHAYRSWNADNPRGYVKRDRGIQAPDSSRAAFYDSQAVQPPTLITEEHKDVLFWILAEACERRRWRIHAMAAEPTHIHFLVSWREFTKWEVVRGKLKNLMSLMLGKHFATPNRSWFVGSGSRKRVRSRNHFEYLMNHYFPKHRWYWREGDPVPVRPEPLASAGGYQQS